MPPAREIRCPTCGHAWVVDFGPHPLTRADCPDCGATLWAGASTPPRRTLRFFWARVGLQFALTIAVFAAGVTALQAGRLGLAAVAIGSAVVFAVLERADYAMAASVLRDRFSTDAQ